MLRRKRVAVDYCLNRAAECENFGGASLRSYRKSKLSQAGCGVASRRAPRCKESIFSNFVQIDGECPTPIVALLSFPGRGTLTTHD